MSDEFDEVVRSRIRAGNDSPEPAHAVLQSLQPRMRRARRRHRVMVAAVSGGSVVLVGVGATALAFAFRSPDADWTVRSSDSLPAVSDDGDAPIGTSGVVDDDTSGDDTSGDDPVGADDRESTTTTPDVGITITDGNHGAEPPSVQPGGDGSTAPIPTTPPQWATPSSPRASTPDTTAPPTGTQPTPPPTTPTTSTPPTTTTAPTTTEPTSGEQVIGSDCGSITVAYDATTVTLLDTQPNPGFAVDVKSDGTDEVEVGFADADLECEIHARMASGRLVVRVNGPGD